MNLTDLSRHPTVLKIIRFVLSGGTAAAFQLLLYIALSRPLGLNYLVATSISFICALVVSFLLQKYVTFQDKDQAAIPNQFALYAGFAVFNLAANSLLMYTFVSLLGIHDIAAQVMVMGTIAVWSFVVYQKFIFRQREYATMQQ